MAKLSHWAELEVEPLDLSQDGRMCYCVSVPTVVGLGQAIVKNSWLIIVPLQLVMS